MNENNKDLNENDTIDEHSTDTEENTQEYSEPDVPKKPSTLQKIFSTIIDYKDDLLQNLYQYAVIFPITFIVTGSGAGFLPEWQKHWASVAAFILSSIIVYNTVSFFAAPLEIAVVLLVSSMICILLTLLSITIYQNKNSEAKDEIVIHVITAQILTLSLSSPAFFTIGQWIIKVYSGICGSLFYCASWFFVTLSFLSIMSFPFLCFRFFDTIQPWPIGIINLRYNNAFSKLFEGIIAAIYASITLYIIAFIFSDLTLTQSVYFLKSLLHHTIMTISTTNLDSLIEIDLEDLLDIKDSFQDFIREQEENLFDNDALPPTVENAPSTPEKIS